jgi:hypothetical protein
MRRFSLILFVAGAVYGAFRYAVVDPPWRAFRAFARDWAREDTPAAAAWTSGEAAKKAVEEKILRGVVRAPMEAFRGSREELESRETASDGAVILTVRQSVSYDPPGVTSGVGGAGVATIRHVARMRKTPDGWRIVEWTPEFLEAKPRR